MKNIEFFRNVSIGQYIDAKSPVHALTPATKYLILLSLAVPALVSPSWPGIVLAFAGAAILSRGAKVPLGFLLRGASPALPVLALTAALQALFAWPGDATARLVVLGPVALTAMELRLIMMTTLRFFAFMAIIGLFTSVTSEREVAYGVEDFLAPLSRLGFPSHALALAVAMSFRFVPIVASELEAIVKAQASRGGDFGATGAGPIRKAKAYLPLFVPVVVRALERAELLVEAMESRRYSGVGRTRYATFAPTRGENAFRIGAILFAATAMAAGVAAAKYLSW